MKIVKELGIYSIEKDLSDNNVVPIDSWIEEEGRVNANWMITGMVGIGKTHFEKQALIMEHRAGAKIIVLDACREYADVVKKCHNSSKGTVIKCQLSDSPANYIMADFTVLDIYDVISMEKASKKEEWKEVSFLHDVILCVWTQMSKSRSEKVIFCIDNAILERYENLYMLLNNIFMRARAYNSAVWYVTDAGLGSHQVEKFKRQMASNSTYHLILGCSEEEIASISNELNIEFSKNEKAALLERRRGIGLLVLGKEHFMIKI